MCWKYKNAINRQVHILNYSSRNNFSSVGYCSALHLVERSGYLVSKVSHIKPIKKNLLKIFIRASIRTSFVAKRKSH